MNTLTQVWVFSIALCSVILVSFFKFAGRLGLFIGFITSLVLLYLLLHKGLKLFLEQTKAQLHKGSDPTGINILFEKYQSKYPINKYFLYFTDQKSQPLVWRDFQDDIHVILNKQMVQNLDPIEKKLLVHLMFSHGTKHSKFRRRLCSIFYLALYPISRFLSPVFNLAAKLLQIEKQIFKSDLLAMSTSESVSPAQMNDFSLFLRKLHHLSYHQIKYVRGENYFSILSTSSKKIFNLNLCPPLNIRLTNLMGERQQ
jgi:hypothetical protein